MHYYYIGCQRLNICAVETICGLHRLGRLQLAIGPNMPLNSSYVWLLLVLRHLPFLQYNQHQ